MRLKDHLLKLFARDEIKNRLLGGYYIKTKLGDRAIITKKGFRNFHGGAEFHQKLAKLGKALWGSLSVSGSLNDVAHMKAAGAAVGVGVGVMGQKRWFGLAQDPPPALPEKSGTHQDQKLIWSDIELRHIGLLGWRPGEGVRIGASLESGASLRYAGPDAENSILGFGPPGSGKGVAFQIPAIIDTASAPPDKRISTFTIDPSGQLFAACAPELRRQGVRVLPIMPFTDGLPAEIRRLANIRAA